jgi:hypothetical protein
MIVSDGHGAEAESAGHGRREDVIGGGSAVAELAFDSGAPAPGAVVAGDAAGVVVARADGAKNQRGGHGSGAGRRSLETSGRAGVIGAPGEDQGQGQRDGDARGACRAQAGSSLCQR